MEKMLMEFDFRYLYHRCPNIIVISLVRLKQSHFFSAVMVNLCKLLDYQLDHEYFPIMYKNYKKYFLKNALLRIIISFNNK